jgi:hypothetical protein
VVAWLYNDAIYGNAGSAAVDLQGTGLYATLENVLVADAAQRGIVVGNQNTEIRFSSVLACGSDGVVVSSEADLDSVVLQDNLGNDLLVSDGIATLAYSQLPAMPAGIVDGGGNGWNTPGTFFVRYHKNLPAAEWDLHLDSSSPLFDLGNPAYADPDGSNADPGFYGGPLGASDYLASADGDALPDLWEIAWIGDTSYGNGGDFDQDGRTNLFEYVNHLDPGNDDTDGDGTDDLTDNFPINAALQ